MRRHLAERKDLWCPKDVKVRAVSCGVSAGCEALKMDNRLERLTEGSPRESHGLKVTG